LLLRVVDAPAQFGFGRGKVKNFCSASAAVLAFAPAQFGFGRGLLRASLRADLRARVVGVLAALSCCEQSKGLRLPG